jgi:hypothetical protein
MTNQLQGSPYKQFHDPFPYRHPDRSQWSCGGGTLGGGILANPVKTDEKKSDFRLQKALPTPDFATASEKKYRGYKKVPVGSKSLQGVSKK